LFFSFRWPICWFAEVGCIRTSMSPEFDIQDVDNLFLSFDFRNMDG
jgi:hypothetical protein